MQGEVLLGPSQLHNIHLCHISGGSWQVQAAFKMAPSPSWSRCFVGEWGKRNDQLEPFPHSGSCQDPQQM